MKNQWQRSAEIISKTAKLYARHTRLLALVPEQRTLSDVYLLLVEIGLVMKAVLQCLDEMERLGEQRQPSIEARSEHT